jgi:hypothetical protein
MMGLLEIIIKGIKLFQNLNCKNHLWKTQKRLKHQ